MNDGSTQPNQPGIPGEIPGVVSGVASQQPATQHPNTSTSVPPDLQTALNAYKTNYAAYKVTGQTGFKTAYESALAAVNQAIKNVQATTQSNEDYIREFVSSYEDTNSEVADLQKKSKQIQSEGPALQDELAQAQQLHSHTVAAADETSLYIKASIVFGLLIIVGIVGAL